MTERCINLSAAEARAWADGATCLIRPVKREIHIGQRFGRLTVIGKSPGKSKDGKPQWVCRCDCGGPDKLVISNLLNRGTTRSCGCLMREVAAKKVQTHGHTAKGVISPTFSTWDSMLKRCSQTNHKSFHDYGGRGITVCERWMSFELFLEDMGERPSGTTLDRVDNALGYFKENCRWATLAEQGRNKRNNRMVEFAGKRMTLAEAIASCGINAGTVNSRIYADRWPVEKALTTPVRQKPTVSVTMLEKAR